MSLPSRPAVLFATQSACFVKPAPHTVHTKQNSAPSLMGTQLGASQLLVAFAADMT